MKVLVVLLGLITATFLSGVAAVKVKITAYNATGELDITKEYFITLGTRVLLTCDVIELPEGTEVGSYNWFHNCTELHNPTCEIQDKRPYYRVVNDTLLVDVTSQDQGGRYYCNADSLPVAKAGITREVTVTENRAPFLYIPTSIVPEHSVLTDVQQATTIKCRSGVEGTRSDIWMGSELVVNSSTANSATIGLGSQLSNGLYHCLSAQSQREYFSIYLRNNTIIPPTPTVSARNTSMWNLSSPDGSRVERYIVEFECKVRNITFVEKYMSVNASGGIGRVATSASCFGTLGQLYRVKVWAVSGPNISRALVCITDRQCREEDYTPTPSGRTPTMSMPMPSMPGNADNPNTDGQSRGTLIGVWVGVGVFLLLLVLFTVAALIVVVVVVVKRKAVCKWKRKMAPRRGRIQYTNTTVVMQEVERNQRGAGYEDIDIYDIPDGYNLQNGKVEDASPIADGCIQYENFGRVECTKKRAQKKSSTPARATIVHAEYAVTGVSNTITNQHHVKKPQEPEYGYFAKDNDQYAVPMMKRGRMTDNGEVVVVSGGMEEEQYDDTAQHTYRRW